jgi:hypothetical protein
MSPFVLAQIFGKLLDRIEDEGSSLVIEKRGYAAGGVAEHQGLRSPCRS